jgi:hypothetical protein
VALEWIRTKPETCIWGVLFQTVFLGTLVARVVLTVAAENWKLVALNLVVLDFFGLLAGVSVVLDRRAKETERATLLRLGS